jgi:biopolymer transport protein ExbD
LLLIFFMVSEAVNSQKRLNFPEAKSSKEVDPRHATLVTIREPASAGEAPEYILGENTSTTSDLETVRQFIEKGAKDGNRTVLVRAEKRVLHKDVLGVAELLSTIDGTNLSIAIEEPR